MRLVGVILFLPRAVPSWLSLFVSPAHWCHPEKSFYICLKTWLMWLLTNGHFQISCLWWPVGLTKLAILQVCMYLQTIKIWCLRVWLLVSLNIGAEILPFGALTGTGTSSIAGSCWTCSRLLIQTQRFEKQSRPETGLKVKFHLLYKIIPSRLGEVVVSSTIEISTQRVKQN